MKILIINGSPRKNGNTMTAVKHLEQKISQNNQVETVQAYSFHINPCLSCYQCAKNGGTCVQKDDTAAILDKIAAADMIIFATPVYWWGMSAQLKLIIDKFISRVSAFQEMPKKIASIAVGASGTEDTQYRLIREQFKCIGSYLNWEYKACTAFSAWQAGDLEKYAGLDAKIQEFAEKIQ